MTDRTDSAIELAIVRSFLAKVQSAVEYCTGTLGGVSAYSKRVIAMSADAVVAVAAIAAATYVRLGYVVVDSYLALFPLAAFATVCCFWLAGMYSVVLHRSDGGEVPRIVFAVAASAVAFMGLMYLLSPSPNPRSLWLIFGVALLVGSGGLRSLWRWLVSGRSHSKLGAPVAIYGAGILGQQTNRFLDSGDVYRAAYWLDDNPEIQGRTIGRLKVLAPDGEHTSRLLQEAGVNTVLMAMSGASGEKLKKALQNVQGFNCAVRTVPPVGEFLANRVTAKDLKSVKLEDLIGRRPIAPTRELMQKNITGKVVMVTGAGGSVGSELCRQIALLRPAALVLFEISEPSLYYIDMELREGAAAGTTLDIHPILGSVTDRDKLEAVIGEYGVQTMFHAAAYKHVPLVEQNVAAGACVNVQGTEAAVDAALKLNVETFVFISTDKAVRPSSVMGATKRLAELVVQAKAAGLKGDDGTKLCIVRFGNVIGSSGSVIPRFQKQIESGGPITVTHKDVNRFFMSIPEAAQLVIQAGTLAQNGDVLLLDMGEPVKITEVARSLVHLHGLTLRDADYPYGDIEMSITGLRPGEKITEELLIDDTAVKTEHPKIVRAREVFATWGDLSKLIANIYDQLDGHREAALREAIFALAQYGQQESSPSGRKHQQSEEDRSVVAEA